VTNGSSIEERLEEMSRRLERVERANRAMKIWGSIAAAAMVAFGSGSFASNVLAKTKVTAKVVAQEFDLETATGQVKASLKDTGGVPVLEFFDASEKLVVGVGLASTTSAGITVFDGNSVLAGSGVPRNTWGVTAGASGGIGGVTFDGSGKVRTLWGDAVNESFSGISFFDSNGAFRTGVAYDPTTSLTNGFSTEDGSGHTLSFLGNVLGTVGLLSANDSVMDLFDTAGTLRVFEFENSANEGGLAFNAGSATPYSDDWGNP